MTITFLGTGTSTGVPQVGCNCPVCTSLDPRDKRLRCSALFDKGDTRVLIDAGPDLRAQMLSVSFRHIDGVLLTHEHYDHIGGVDDLRPHSAYGDVNLYADDLCASHLKERLPYCLQRSVYPGVPKLKMICVCPHQRFKIGDICVTALRVMHGKLPILGYRLDDVAYITDMKTIPESELQYLQGLKVLVVNGLRHEPHPTHQTIEDAIAFSRSLGSPQTFIIHMSHHIAQHAAEDALLPEGFHLAFDGLRVEV